MSLLNEQLKDIASAEQAYLRVHSDVESMSAADVGPMNVDVVTATSTVPGVADRIVPYHDQMAQLPDFDVKYVDNLVNYALAAWYTYKSSNEPWRFGTTVRVLLRPTYLGSVALRTFMGARCGSSGRAR